MLNRLVKVFGGDPNKRKVEELAEIAEQINTLENEYEKLSDEQLRAKTDEFRSRLSQGETLDDILVEAFATVREASKRTIGLRHFDVQLIGGIAMHNGMIAEMRTGEGKTLAATLPLYLNALTGKGTHLITVNDYLARRDARWMAPIYDLLGLSVGVLQMASRTESGKKAFLVDLSKSSPHEDQHQLRMVPRAEAYAADITYGTNSEFGFDYLRDNMAMRLEDRVQRGHYYAIIDEVDNVLIDEARTPLIISGPAQDETEWYIRTTQIVKALRPEDYEINEKDRTVTLTEIGISHVEDILGMPLRDPDRPEDITLEQARILGYLEQALRAQFLFKRNKDYLVQAGKVVIVDEFTGRLMPGRRWSDGLHQAIEAKEGVRVQSESVTYATITIQNYFRMYEKLAGMTGTAATESEEFDQIYNLGVLVIPTNLEYIASLPDSRLEELQDSDEEGYRYTYYAYRDDPEKKPVFWKRKDYPDVIYRTEEAKFRAIVKEILTNHVIGRPVLVGTTSVELSDRLASRLRAEPVKRLAQTLIIRELWMQTNQRGEDGRAIPELQFLNQPLEKLDISAMRKMSRELGVSLNPLNEENLATLLQILGLFTEHKERLTNALQSGIPNQVLNARKHTEESQIIAGAGAFGAVTIATNMAGRGVDIKLGGELAEEIISQVNRVLKRSGVEDPYDLSLDEKRAILLSMDKTEYGIYESEIQFFLNYLKEMGLVRELGGLHVIGSERHDARRIDNQLRGRSARQGDPGSSRFFLSMEDELMRLFGGQQADSLMQRLRLDDAVPLEVGLVGRLIEQAQTRVEGANFDVRKHLLEYDDVLNSQRMRIYDQRNRIFHKEDLTEDVIELLQAEVRRRVPEALQNEAESWKLIAWLDQIQPPLPVNEHLFPSYSLRLLLERFNHNGSFEALQKSEVRTALIELTHQAIEAEKEHIIRATQDLIEQIRDSFEQHLDDANETIDIFLEASQYEDEASPQSPAQMLNQLSGALRIPIKLPSQQQKILRDNPEEGFEIIRETIETGLFQRNLVRLVGAVSRRLEQPLSLDMSQFSEPDWDSAIDFIFETIDNIFNERFERYLGDNGLVIKDIDTALERAKGEIDEQYLLRILLTLPHGTKTTFDRKTHARKQQRTRRFTYTFHVAEYLDGEDPDLIAEEVLEHMQNAQQAMQSAWGAAELERLSDSSIQQLDDGIRTDIIDALPDLAHERINAPLNNLSDSQKEVVKEILGKRLMSQIYRQLLLGVITELWVDYLTQMEALRVSIGLEAYAQRDPLVQYKTRAGELFQQLLSNMRTEVVGRMFTYRPRDVSSIQADTTAPSPVPEEILATEKAAMRLEQRQPQAQSSAQQQQKEQGKKGKKRRRRRRR